MAMSGTQEVVEACLSHHYPLADDAQVALRSKWRARRKHFFVFSNAGKPIFSRYGDECDISDFFGVMQALISCVLDANDNLEWLVAGKHQFVFLTHGPLYFILVASTGELHASLLKQLNTLYDQIIFHLTSGLEQIFAKKASYDLRLLLGGTDPTVRSLVHNMNHNPGHFLSAVRSLPLPRDVRQAIGDELAADWDDTQLAAMLLAGDTIVQVVSRQALHPKDCLLLINYVNSTPSLRISTNFSPICLPHYTDKGMVYAYIDFLMGAPCKSQLCLVMLSTVPDTDRFDALNAARDRIKYNLLQNGVVDCIATTMQLPGYGYTMASLCEDLQLPELRHVLYKQTTSQQYFAPAYKEPYCTEKEQKRLLQALCYMRMRVRRSGLQVPHMQVCVHQRHVICMYLAADFELYCCFDAMYTDYVWAMQKISAWVQQRSRFVQLFIQESQAPHSRGSLGHIANMARVIARESTY